MSSRNLLRVVWSVLASVALVLSMSTPSAATTGDAELVLVSVQPAEPVAGETVTFTWRVTDPDPFSDVEDLSIHYGDRPHSPPLGRPLMCGEVLLLTGLDHTFSTLHTYQAAGTYLVRGELTTRQSLCGTRLGDPDRAPPIERQIVVG